MIWIEILGWIPAILTLLAYSMRTMLPLRMIAIAVNLFFNAYGARAHIYPDLGLHLLLLPFNIYRLTGILRMTRRLRRARNGEFDARRIPQLLPARPFADGEVPFRKGDPPHNLHHLVSGRIRLAEADIALEAGAVSGEIAFFSDAKERTLTAVYDGPCRIVTIDAGSFMQL